MTIPTFKNKKEVEQYTKDTIQRISVCNDIKEKHPESFEFFVKYLFPKHPSFPKKFKYMSNIGIRRNPVFNQLELVIIRNNNTTDNVSWRKCLGKKVNPLNAAMRNAVSSQILDFKYSQDDLTCRLCGKYDSPHVDHKDPKFRDLTKNFLTSLNGVIPIPKQFRDNKFNGKIFKESDSAFEKLWQEYHQEHSKLQILCWKCNISLG